MAAIALRGVTKVFGPRPAAALARLRGAGKEEMLAASGHTLALRDVTLAIEAGEIFVVMGLSGSGKSTLLRLVNRLIAPTKGRVIVHGRDLATLSGGALTALRRHVVSMVFQGFALLPHRDVLANAAYGLETQGMARAERETKARAWIDAVGLAGYEGKRPAELSGGMRQRVGLARALATDAEILLMDEPFAALDPLIRRDMQDQLLALQRRLRRTIVFITHDLAEALRLGDRVTVLKDGAVVQTGTPADIVLRPADAYVRDFGRDVDRARVLTAADVMANAVAVEVDTAPIEALARFGAADATLFVLGDDGRLAGVVGREEAAAAYASGRTGLGARLRATATLAPATRLANCLGAVAASPGPVAVVDADGRLMGALTADSIVRALAQSGVRPRPTSC